MARGTAVGAQPWGLKGVHFEGDIGFQGMETAGLPDAMDAQVVVTRYNDAEMLEDRFREYGDRIACFIVEPFIGAGGMLPAAPEFLRTARALTARYGAVLIFDEIVSGFRFRAGDTGRMYGVQPDLAAFGKVIGGGMPVAAVGGRAEIMALAGRKGGMRVAFSGGTYSGHPASLLAAKTMLEHLVAHEAEIYPRLTELAILAHRTVEKAFMDEGIYARCTGYGNEVLPESASAMLLFPYDEGVVPRSPDAARNPEICDLVLGEEVLRVAMLLEGVHVTHGLGSVTTAHTEDDLQFLGDACRRVARRIGPYLA
ncbi:aminotransferase class III-fold pyridoxal phosphate-dependent enzyme [Candidatus Bipolaricaulota bacterium]|nr:aminotransferase class III-fold pyridoxal phosphate-dependent enzyme [Candidatus Bipolaricaulota bacterium]